MKTIIMAGGKGTRIASVASDIPKPMIPVSGKPVLEHQLNVLKAQGIKEVTLITGHLGNVIREHFRDGSSFGISIDYVEENEPLGTGGALSFFRDCKEDILLVFGDILFDIDISSMYEAYLGDKAEVLLFTHPNSHPYDSVLIETDDEHRVRRLITKEDVRRDYVNRVNAGIHILSPSLLQTLPEKPVKLDFDRDIMRAAIERGKVYAYDSTEYVHDMGTPDRYGQVCRDLESGLVAGRNRKKKQKAVFLDRDGTINKEIGFFSDPDKMELVPEAAEAIRMFNSSEYLVIVVTNQSIIARGECTVEGLKAVHRRMYRLLGEKGAYVDGLYYCPHHPDSGFEGEVKELKIECECRKPKPGMLLQAAREHNIDLNASWMIGDSERDMKAGENAGCRTIFSPEGLTKEIAEQILKS
ncbi:MAG: HAD-IIIA family hydrolase [Lachnospiraceae bacterium]|nr:HAD-IIIA family hydrolase [Lachnospiraceae bacterium]